MCVCVCVYVFVCVCKYIQIYKSHKTSKKTTKKRLKRLKLKGEFKSKHLYRLKYY